MTNYGTSLAVQWLRLRAPNARDMSSIPGQGTKIPHITQQKKSVQFCGQIQKRRTEKYPLDLLMWRSYVP